MKALSTLDSSTQYIVLFKLTNFNSVTVIISHWLLLVIGFSVSVDQLSNVTINVPVSV